MIVSIDGERVDIGYRVAITLQNIYELGGTANTRDITHRSGLDAWEVREAAEQASDRGLVESIGYDDASYGPGHDPTLFELTGHGRQVVCRGVPGKVVALQDTDARVPEANLTVLKEKLGRLESQVKNSQSKELEKRFDELQAKLDADSDPTDDEVAARRADVTDLEEYVYEWNEAVETYLYALRRIVEEQLDVSFDAYLREVGDEESE